MKDSEIAAVADRVLRERFAQSGFRTADAATEIDFDGAPIVRIRAKYEGGPLKDIRAIIDAEAAIQNELWRQGDNRFVFLNNEYPDLDEEEEDDDEGRAEGDERGSPFS